MRGLRPNSGTAEGNEEENSRVDTNPGTFSPLAGSISRAQESRLRRTTALITHMMKNGPVDPCIHMEGFSYSLPVCPRQLGAGQTSGGIRDPSEFFPCGYRFAPGFFNEYFCERNN